jgi:hypothetical protein
MLRYTPIAKFPVHATLVITETGVGSPVTFSLKRAMPRPLDGSVYEYSASRHQERLRERIVDDAL